jgi:hypothetical protein
MLASMTSRISHTAVDSRDAYAQSVWWAQVLNMAEDPDDPNEPGDEECLIVTADRSTEVLFIEVPEAKQVKNRIHFDLRPIDRTRDEEIERVLALGAIMVADRRNDDGTGWMVLVDPEAPPRRDSHFEPRPHSLSPRDRAQRVPMRLKVG